MTFNEVQVYLFAVALGAIFGAYHGWRREAISMGIILATVIFLMLNGVQAVASLSASATNSLVPTASAKGLSGGGPNGPPAPSSSSDSYQRSGSQFCANPVSLETISLFIFFIMVVLAYRIGWKFGTPAKNSSDRILGLIPGAINGGAIMFYLSHSVFRGQVITLFSPTGWQAAHYLPLVIAAAFVGLVVLILIGTQARKSASASH